MCPTGRAAQHNGAAERPQERGRIEPGRENTETGEQAMAAASAELDPTAPNFSGAFHAGLDQDSDRPYSSSNGHGPGRTSSTPTGQESFASVRTSHESG